MLGIIRERADIEGSDILSKIRSCPGCGILPSLFTMNVWEFDYNCLENLGCVRKSHQLACKTCDRHTVMVATVYEAIGLWNWQAEESSLGVGKGG